jgi:hypothetical protein
MKASPAAVLTFLLVLAGCAAPGQLLFGGPTAVEYLEGNYRSLASCAHKQLGRRFDQLVMSDLRERRAVKVSSADGRWTLSFIDEDDGQQTRLEVSGAFPGEHVLALARACAA